jgi:hypothetical protein
MSDQKTYAGPSESGSDKPGSLVGDKIKYVFRYHLVAEPKVVDSILFELGLILAGVHV